MYKYVCCITVCAKPWVLIDSWKPNLLTTLRIDQLLFEDFLYPYRQQAKKRWGGLVTHHFLEFILNSMTLRGQINNADDQFWLLLWLLLNTFSSKIENTRGPTCIVSPNTANSIAPHVMQVQRLGPLCYVLNFERFKRGIANLVRYSLKYRASANIKTIINFIQYLVWTYIKKNAAYTVTYSYLDIRFLINYIYLIRVLFFFISMQVSWT